MARVRGSRASLFVNTGTVERPRWELIGEILPARDKFAFIPRLLSKILRLATRGLRFLFGPGI